MFKRLSGETLWRNLCLNNAMCSSNFSFEELLLKSLRASPLMKPFMMPGGWSLSHIKNRVPIQYNGVSPGPEKRNNCNILSSERSFSLLHIKKAFLMVRKSMFPCSPL